MVTDPPALLGVCIAIGVLLAVVRGLAHAPAAAAVPVLQQFALAIDEQYHECVPLGWYPEKFPRRGYVPVYNMDVVDRGAVLQSQWVAVVPERLLADPHAASVKGVLEELTRLGLLTRTALPGGFRYNLTREGQRYYYERNGLGNNVEWWSYLCFSRLHATDVAWASRPSKGKGTHGDVTARIRFSWDPTPAASWATPFLKAHAVELNPTSSPADATARRTYDGKWKLTHLDFSFPIVAHPAAWTAGGRAPESI